ncbi:class I SAM-dependent methyltransferase [Halopseudomonas salegens]|uniref:Methyltransferase domain-containing protein n=1 Tax=Halopseudomonas salegens TaxID=1434072 RepID=A0A1H2ERU8_9GAMM|nr:class I SAM-dependent methyltransferase [Halopseudomonas salegens]SDT97902.1 Methyltransferase domain-containing protein [Halopseudomonas salegens]
MMDDEHLQPPCPLCRQATQFACRDRRRPYFHCAHCAMVHVAAPWHLSASDERAQYDLHDNQVDDPAYRRFLSRLTEPLLARLPDGATGLDFGCGPGPALATMLHEQGHPTAVYDIYYAPDNSVFEQQWDFITSTEVVEHLARPLEELQRVWQCLKPGGWLGIMTKRVSDLHAFAHWHYKNDPTHVSFFSEQSFVWLAQRWQATLDVVGPDVVLLQKPAN